MMKLYPFPSTIAIFSMIKTIAAVFMSRNVGSGPQISSMGITINLMVSVPIISAEILELGMMSP